LKGNISHASTLIDSKELAIRSILVMADGTLEDFRDIVHPLALDRDSVDEPPAARGQGPEAFYATALWLRGIFADLRWDVDTVVAEGDLVAVHATMSGRQIAPFVSYGENAEPVQVIPRTGKTFATTPTHWLRIADGKVIEHWANRDDMGTSMQLGWVPPSPVSIVRMVLALRRARRAARRSG
jgi:predicted ester cyclase